MAEIEVVQKIKNGCANRDIKDLDELYHKNPEIFSRLIEPMLKQLFEELTEEYNQRDKDLQYAESAENTMRFMAKFINFATDNKLKFSLDFYNTKGESLLYWTLLEQEHQLYVCPELEEIVDKEQAGYFLLTAIQAAIKADPNVFPLNNTGHLLFKTPPIIKALKDKKYGIAAMLFKMGASMYEKEKEENDPFNGLIILAQSCEPTAVELFKQVLAVTSIDKFRETFTHRDLFGNANMLLTEMASSGAVENLQLLLEKYPDLADGSSITALLFAMEYLASQKSQEKRSRLFNTIRVLIEAGTPLDTPDSYWKEIPMEGAASRGLLEVVQLIANYENEGIPTASAMHQYQLYLDNREARRETKRISVELSSKPESHRDKRLLPDLFVRSKNNIIESIPTVEYLTGYLESHSVTFNDLQQALKLCSEIGNKALAELLVRQGADPEHLKENLKTENENQTIFINKVAMDLKISTEDIISSFEASKKTILSKTNPTKEWENFQEIYRPKLLTAIFNNDEDKIIELIKSGVDPNFSRNVPLTRYEFLPSEYIKISHSGAALNMAGMSPLYLACYSGNPKTLSLLLRCGASITKANEISEIINGKPLREINHFPNKTQTPLLRSLIIEAERTVKNRATPG